MRILLVKPDISEFSVGFTSLARTPPMELLTVAASVADHECRILDMRLEKDSAFEEELSKFKPELIGLTAYTAEAEVAKTLARRAKRVLPDVPIVWGGYHATMALDDALDEASVDIAVLAEGDVTFPELVRAFARGDPFDAIPGIAFRKSGHQVVTPARAQVDDLDSLSFLDWELVSRYQPHYYLGVMGVVGGVETTRGCPYDCDFCSVWVFNQRRYRKKSPARVVADLEGLPDGIQVAAFVDDEFWVDDQRSLEIAALINERNRAGWKGSGWTYWAQVRTSDVARRPELVEQWAKAGLKVLLLGIESHKDQEVAELHHKRTTVSQATQALRTMRQHGVEAWGCFVVNPAWEEGDFYDLMEFVNKCEIAFPQFTVLTPLPGTVLTNKLVDAGEVRASDIPHSLLDFLHVTYPKPRLPLRRFYELLADLYRTTSMGANIRMYRRLVRNGVIARGWLHSDMGRKVTSFLGQLTNAESYLKAHWLLGENV
ncbi:MAG: cobalamin-dependent protein [Dehalococcoidia bacterium]|nr:MAG: cobalamin-dependent protein [Dehalococcoidia bacterium]